MRQLAIALVLALSTGAAAEESKPPEGKPDRVRAVVHLKDGGVVRGGVKRMRLGKSITLALPSGKSVTLDDADVVSIELLGGAAPPDAAAADEAPSPKGKRGGEPAAKPSEPARTPPLPRQAPHSNLDTVYLNDGGLLRGTIVKEKPEVVIRLVSGRERAVPAASVQRIERARKP